MVGARFVKRVGERGVVTLPAEVREVLDVAEGDIVEFEILRVVKKGKKAAPAAPAPATEPAKGDAA